MKLILTFLSLMSFIDYVDIGSCSASEADYVLVPPLDFSHRDALSVPLKLKVIMPVHLSLCSYNAVNSLRLNCLFILKDWYNISINSLPGFVSYLHSKNERPMSGKSTRHRLMVMLLLLISGNVQPNPGPDMPT